MPRLCFEGIADSVHLARSALLKLPEDDRTQALTRRQLATSLSELSKVLQGNIPPTAVAATLVHAEAQATILSDGARASSGEHDGSVYQDLLFWAEAAHRSIKSWQRDIQTGDDADASLSKRLLALAGTARAGPGDGLPLPAGSRTQVAVHRLSRAGQTHSMRVAMTCWHPRPASRASSPLRKTMCQQTTGFASAAQ